jgi:hypothetical protein
LNPSVSFDSWGADIQPLWLFIDIVAMDEGEGEVSVDGFEVVEAIDILCWEEEDDIIVLDLVALDILAGEKKE